MEGVKDFSFFCVVPHDFKDRGWEFLHVPFDEEQEQIQTRAS